jgi:hypothetical protein
MKDTNYLWAELHCHSEYSRDSDIPLPRIIELCQQRKVSIIALTDHNEIAGAQELQQMAPDWLTVIVGEEITTAEGDVIGLYLKKKIEAGLPIAETIQQIKKQGGLVLLPHPFDRIRREAVGGEVLKQIVQDIDALEVFNGRCLWPGDNRRAADFAAKRGLTSFAGSDAHTPGEYGRTLVGFTERPMTAESFISGLRQAKYQKKWAGPLVHGRTFIVKRAKRR